VSKTIEQLAAQVEKLRKGDFSNDNVNNLMNYLRQFSEETGAKGQHGIFKLYADWCVHPALDRRDAKNILNQIQVALHHELTTAPGTFTGNTLVGAISVEKLRQDMKSLLDQAGVSLIITAPEIREELVQKPLKLSDRESSQIAGKNPTGPIVTSLIIERNSDPTISIIKFQIAASVRGLHPMNGAVNIKTPFLIARNAKGEPIC
jgi:hypothetical protein